MPAKIIKISKNMTVLETEYYVWGRKVRKIKVILTQKYKRELEQKFHEYLLQSR